MVGHVSNNISGVLLLSVVAVSSTFWISFGNKNAFSQESQMTFRSLEKALKYVEEQPEIINENLILGVLIAKANLQWIVNTLEDHSRGEDWTDALGPLIKQCDDIIEHNAFTLPLLKRNLWEDTAGDLKFGILKRSEDEFALPVFDSCQSIDDYMRKGTLEDSDLCIGELVTSNCKVSEKCWLSEVNGDFHSGYKTSHRLLYFQVADRVKCDELQPKKFSAIEAVKKKLCQQMLLEAMALSEESHFSLTQDLFMEQIALCGLEGHEEFALEFWRERVRSWQSPEGCFGRDLTSAVLNCSSKTSEENNSKTKTQRTDFNMDGCHSHVTAVGMSALAFFLRVTLKAAFNLF